MEEQEKLTLKICVDAIKNNPMLVVITGVSACFGAFLGVMAYYGGWLG